MKVKDTYQTPECVVFECAVGSVLCVSDSKPGGNEGIDYKFW